MKRFIVCLMAVILIFVMCASVSAVGGSAASPRLSFRIDGAKAICEAAVTSLGSSIEATMTLKQGEETIASWTKTRLDMVHLRYEHNVYEAALYTLELTGTADGIPFSITRQCDAEPTFGHNYFVDAKKFSWSKVVSLDVYPIDRYGVELVCVEYKNGNFVFVQYDESGMTSSRYFNIKRQKEYVKYYEKGRTVEKYVNQYITD